MTTLHDILIAANAEISTVIEFLTRYATTQATITLNNELYTTAMALSRCYTINSAIHAVAYAIRDMATRSPHRLQNDIGLLLELFERNHLVGWESGHALPTLQMIRTITENFMGGPGAHVAFLTPGFIHACSLEAVLLYQRVVNVKAS